MIRWRPISWRCRRCPSRDPNNYVRYSGRAGRIAGGGDANGAVWANRFDNVANHRAQRRGHRAGECGRTRAGSRQL